VSAVHTDRFYLGLDVGRTIRGAMIGADGAIIRQARVVSEVSNPRVFINQLIDVINQLAAEAVGGQAAAAGIGWAGLINRSTQRAEANPNLVDVSSFDLHGEIEAATRLPIIIDNDANMAAYGEWRSGAARGCRDVFFITMGTGIGAGLILDGQLQRGSRGFAGEFGHFKVVLDDGIECGCGSTGCLETLCSGPNIVRRVREQLFSDPTYSLSSLARDMEGTLTGERVVRAAMEKDELALSVLRETGRILGATIASVINLLNVEVVVLGGGVMAAGELILEPIREEVQRSVVEPCTQGLRIVAAELGQDAGIIGAALLARDTFAGRTRQAGG
jgi:glucokinase